MRYALAPCVVRGHSVGERSSCRDLFRGFVCRKMCLLAMLACAGCPPSNPPLPPGPPIVTVAVGAREVVGTDFEVTVEVRNCDRVARIKVLDDAKVLAEVPGSGSNTKVRVADVLLDYKTRGVAAELVLNAEVTCSDGRTGKTSTPVPVTFLPAADVLPGPWPFQDFAVEGSGQTFLACPDDVVRYSRDRTEKARLASPLGCAGAGFLFADKPYLFKPGGGVFAMTSGLVSQFSIVDNIGTLDVDGAGPFYVVIGNGLVSRIEARRRADGLAAWTNPTARPLSGELQGLLARRSGTVLTPLFRSKPADQGDVVIVSFAEADGAEAGEWLLGTVPLDPLNVTNRPFVTFGQGGTVAYFAEPLPKDGHVFACGVPATPSPTQSVCVSNLRFRSPALAAHVSIVFDMPGGLVAVGPSAAYFLDRATGNTIGTPVLPTGALRYLFGLAGAGDAIYLVAGSEAGASEVIGFHAPAQVAFRFTRSAGAFAFDVDTQGQLWLLLNDLVRLKTPAEYRAMQQ